MSPWERRERGGLYYTRSRKEGGRVVREYVGGGILGELAAQLDAEGRERREEEEVIWREERESLEELSSLVEELCEGVETILRSRLLVAGYRRHNRGEWRLKRESGSETATEE